MDLTILGLSSWVSGQEGFTKKAYLRRARINKVKIRQKLDSDEKDNLCKGHVAVGSTVFSRKEKKSHSSWSQTSKGSIQWHEHAEMSRGQPSQALVRFCGFYHEGSGKTLKGLGKGSDMIKFAFWKDNPWLSLGERLEKQGLWRSDYCWK